MNYVLLVQVSQPLQDLNGQESYDRLWDLSNILQDVSQRAAIHELESNVHFALFLEGAVRLEHIVTIAVVQRLQLNQDLLSQLLVLLEWNLLQCDNLLGRPVDRFLNDAAGTLSEHLIRYKVRDPDLDPALAQRLVSGDQCGLVLARGSRVC